MKKFFEKLMFFVVVLLCFNVGNVFASEYSESVLVVSEYNESVLVSNEYKGNVLASNEYKENVLVANEPNKVVVYNVAETSTIKVSESRNESMLLKMYSWQNEKISILVNKLEKEELILIAIVGALLVLLDPIVEKIIKRFSQVNKSIHILKVLIPGVIYKIVNIGCLLVDEAACNRFLANGFRIKPVENTIISWVMQFNVWIFIILLIITVYNLFRNYTLVTSMIKILEAYILYIIVNIVIKLVGMNVIAVIVVIVLSMFIFSTVVNGKQSQQAAK